MGAAQTLAYQPDPRISPARAVAAVKASGKSHVLNGYDFGGYMIAEGVKPYIDGRTELYGEDFFVRHDKALTLNGVDTFFDLLREKDIDVTLLAPAAPAVGLLDRLKSWKRVYADDVAVVHVRNGAPAGGELQ